jgi:hypothetical protein
LVLRAEAEKAAGWKGAPGGDMVPSQTVETETGRKDSVKHVVLHFRICHLDQIIMFFALVFI